MPSKKLSDSGFCLHLWEQFQTMSEVRGLWAVGHGFTAVDLHAWNDS
jgi:hypothetical protein